MNIKGHIQFAIHVKIALKYNVLFPQTTPGRMIMFNKLKIPTVLLIATTVFIPAYAADNGYSTCSVEVAISTPPVQPNERVIFNVSSERGTNKSITLKGGSLPYTFANLICSGTPYNISATLYSAPSGTLLPGAQAIGQCVLKAGDIVMDEENDSVSVVFPYDFNCN